MVKRQAKSRIIASEKAASDPRIRRIAAPNETSVEAPPEPPRSVPAEPATRDNHEPERPRKLLMHRREIDRLHGKTREKGLTIVPTRLYFKGSRAKVEIALARGKDVGDKRQTIKEREMKREMDRSIRR